MPSIKNAYLRCIFEAVISNIVAVINSMKMITISMKFSSLNLIFRFTIRILNYTRYSRVLSFFETRFYFFY